MTKYDDASWHSEGDFPKDLPAEAGATHIGMFVAWCLLHDLASEDTAEDLEDELSELFERSSTPGAFLLAAMDGAFMSDDLDETGNAFTIAYYEGENQDSRYVDDYLATFALEMTDVYRVTDTWDSYDRIAARISARFADWNAAGRPQFIV